MRAKIAGNQVVKFPYTISDLKADYPQKSFRRAPLEDVWTSHSVVPVVEAARPDVSSNQAAVRNAEPSLIDGSWVLGWDVRDKTAEELAAETLAMREAMAPARWAFANAAFANGIISADEAKQWANGNALPAGMDAAIEAAIPDATQLAMAKVQALAAPTVHRLNPMIAILQASENMADEQADALFQMAIAIEKGE